MFQASPHPPDNYSVTSSHPSLRTRDEILEDAQEIIYDCLLTSVQTEEPEEALKLFNAIFLSNSGNFCDSYFLAIQEIAFGNQESVYRSTLKRACYILLNNWETGRKYPFMVQLVKELRTYVPRSITLPPWKLRLRQWLSNFLNSSDYQEMVLLTERFVPQVVTPSTPTVKPWRDRYAYYFLVPQYENSENSQEQRDTVRHVSDQMRYRFKLDLAMYVAHSQASSTPNLRNTQLNSRIADRLTRGPSRSNHANPTGLGDETLRLIKLIVKRHGYFSHSNIARIFHDQTTGLDYFSYKKSLIQYLIFSMEKLPFVKKFQAIIGAKLDQVYPHYDDTVINKGLCQRTCNQVVRFLTTEDGKSPSELFTLLLAQGGALTLVITLLKLVLLSPTVRNYLDLRIAYLAQYYDQFPPEECEWFSYFLDVFSVTFAIHAEGVQYSLVDTQRTPTPSPNTTARPKGTAAPAPSTHGSPTHGYSSTGATVPTPPLGPHRNSHSHQPGTTLDLAQPTAPLPEHPFAATIEDLTLFDELPTAAEQSAWSALDRYRIFAQSTRAAVKTEDLSADLTADLAEEGNDPDDLTEFSPDEDW